MQVIVRLGVVAAYVVMAAILYVEWVGWLVDAIWIWVVYAVFFAVCCAVVFQKGFTWRLVPAVIAVSVPFLSRLYSLIFL